jgi:hypothetical protein
LSKGKERSIETHFSSYIASQLSPTTIMFSQTCFNGNQKKEKEKANFKIYQLEKSSKAAKKSLFIAYLVINFPVMKLGRRQ